MNRIERLKNKIKVVPQEPGVYLFKDKNEQVIYVGKAIKLRNRLLSYFRDNQEGKTKVLVSRIQDFETIKVETEADALLLENTLIKKYQPRYNILLKDGKSYPWICIKKERFPRVFMTRNVIKDGSEYFGPYTNVKFVYVLLDLIRQLFPLRTCKFDLSEEKIQAGKYKICLDYHIKKCLGPCKGLQSEETYQEDIKQIRQILKGNSAYVLDYLKIQMKNAASNLEFETAQFWKEKWDALQDYSSKSTVVSASIHNVDVFTILSDDQEAYVNYFKIMNGSIIQSFTSEYKKKVDISDEELLKRVVVEIRNKFSSKAKQVLINIPEFEIEGFDARFSTPKIGDKKKLIDLSEKNVKYYRLEKWKHIQQTDPEKHSKRILTQVQKDLRLTELPTHIECFDNSNFQGAEPVAACVVFKNARPSKKDYRHFLIKTVVGPDDFASMTEVLTRRYSRMLKEGESLPHLIVVDGGKGQLSAGVKALENVGLKGKVPIIGIAKRLEEIFFPGDSYPLYLDKRSESLKLIQKMRDEAHRFGITHHRGRRINNSLKSELEEIKGLGKVTIEKLLKHFGSVKSVIQADEKDLINLVGIHRTKLITEWRKQK